MIVNVVIGGEFEGREEVIINSVHECFNLKIQYEQLQVLMKLLDYMGKFKQF